MHYAATLFKAYHVPLDQTVMSSPVIGEHSTC